MDRKIPHSNTETKYYLGGLYETLLGVVNHCEAVFGRTHWWRRHRRGANCGLETNTLLVDKLEALLDIFSLLFLSHGSFLYPMCQWLQSLTGWKTLWPPLRGLRDITRIVKGHTCHDLGYLMACSRKLNAWCLDIPSISSLIDVGPKTWG